MEVTLEQVEKVRACTGASYAEARAALEECRGSVLDAVILLEQRGKRAGGGAGGDAAGDRSTRGTPPKEGAAAKKKPVGPKVRRAIRSVFANCTTVTVDVWKGEQRTCRVPFLAALILVVVRRLLMGVLFLIGMCHGYRVRVAGKGTEEWGESFNRVMDRVGDTIQDATSSMRKNREKGK